MRVYIMSSDPDVQITMKVSEAKHLRTVAQQITKEAMFRLGCGSHDIAMNSEKVCKDLVGQLKYLEEMQGGQ